MDRLISLLLDNIYWVVVIGGVLFSLFGRSGSKKGNPKMPDFGGGSPRNIFSQPKTEEEYDDRAPHAERPVVLRSSEAPTKAARDDQGEGQGSGEGAVSGTLERALKAAATRSASTSPFGRAKSSATTSSSAPQSTQPAAISANADDLRKAVVWAEILGPPRAKRPFGK
ncbi:MAG: hypothetical protein ACE3L7_25325 [Candidatus Pristimantibacillus sp.]